MSEFYILVFLRFSYPRVLLKYMRLRPPQWLLQIEQKLINYGLNTLNRTILLKFSLSKTKYTDFIIVS